MRAAATAGGPSGCGGRSRSSTSCASTTSAASSRTGPCPRARRTRAAGAGCAGPGRAVFDAAARELGALPVIAEDLGVITAPVDARCAASSASRAWSSCSSASIPATRTAPHRPSTTSAAASSTPARTTTTPAAAGGTRCPTRRAARRGRRSPPPGVRRGRAVLVAHPPDALVARAAGDDPGAGRARPRLRGADEHPRPRDGLVALADGAGRADRRARRAAARGDEEAGRLARRASAPAETATSTTSRSSMSRSRATFAV